MSTATGAHVTTIMMKSDKYPLDRGSRDDLQKRSARLEPGGRGRIVIDDDEQITCQGESLSSTISTTITRIDTP